jgi:UDP-N-acetylmuramoylalanine--D-glutamate ligase
MTELLNFFRNKKVLILGFGLEGKSTLKLIQDLPCEIVAADKNPEALKDLPYLLYEGEQYLDSLHDGSIDVIMKAPGISFKGLDMPDYIRSKITSQTDLLLRFRRNTIVGITGTKGKSTVSSLVYHILKRCGKEAALIGNIGVPPLENNYPPETILVCEMSCHQLEFVQASPDIAIFLNLYEEHLDHYNSYADYRAAKENIFLYQEPGDVLFYNDELTSLKLLSSQSEKQAFNYAQTIARQPIKTRLPGKHNQYNIAVAVAVCVKLGCGEAEAVKVVESFNGLPHRLEYVGTVNNAEYINDSISTIPKAVISAFEAYPDTDTLIVGGMDRGINYDELIAFLPKCGIINVIALPESGHKIAEALTGSRLAVYLAHDMEDAVKHAVHVTKRRCILSPAAASYNVYKNFEERGNHFKELVLCCLKT